MRAVTVLALLIAFTAGCGGHSTNPPTGGAANSPAEPQRFEADAPAKLNIAKSDPNATPHLHNLLQLTTSMYSGSEPEGEAGFAELAKLGVKTVVSVDGARPNIDAAKKYGLRYIHIPIGYNGVPSEAGLALARAVGEANAAGETVYFHCHHGKHRGPAGAAVACIAAGSADNEAAKKILEAAGTSPDYPGLWRDVAAYKPPAPGTKLPELVEVAQVGSFAAAMSGIDRGFDNLKLSQAGNWKMLAEHPDIVASQEAIIVKEAFRESVRTLASDRDAEFIKWLRDSEAQAEKLETQLKAGDADGAKQTMTSLEATCKQCHTKHRN